VTKTAPRIIGISGYARVGKDTFADALVEHDGYVKRSFAEPLRQVLYAQNPLVSSSLTLAEVVDHIGWERAKDEHPEVRRLLQVLGTEAARTHLGDDVWVNAAVDALDLKADRYVFADVRFPNEADAILQLGGIIVRIERSGVGPINGHATETAMDDYEFDYVIHNDGTIPELRQRAFDLIAKEQGTYQWPGQEAPTDRPGYVSYRTLPPSHTVVLVPPNVEVRRHPDISGMIVTREPLHQYGYKISEPMVAPLRRHPLVRGFEDYVMGDGDLVRVGR
jgi:hypothetical protein